MLLTVLAASVLIAWLFPCTVPFLSAIITAYYLFQLAVLLYAIYGPARPAH